MHSRTWDRVPQPEGIKLINRRVRAPGGVCFVYRQHNRFAGLEEHRCNLLICCRNSRSDVCYKNNHRCGVNRNLGLFPHKSKDFTIGIRFNAAGIHHIKSPSRPFAGGVQPVACNTRRIFHNRKPLSDKPVE